MEASDCVFSIKPPADNSTLMVYENYNSIKSLQIEPSRILNNRYGQFTHAAIKSAPLSSKVPDVKNSSFIRCLCPTPELWTKAIHMRTQILYRPDIAMIVGTLNIKPGSIVVEAGTGSASLSMSILRALLPSGKLFTFEFNEARAVQAKQEFESLGLGSCVVSEHRDVIENGLKHEALTKADAVFLDLPNPWAAVGGAFEVLANGGAICTFSPCIEQVQKNCAEMEKVGFQGIRTVETLARPLFVKKNKESVAIHHDNSEERLHTGYLSFGFK